MHETVAVDKERPAQSRNKGRSRSRLEQSWGHLRPSTDHLQAYAKLKGRHLGQSGRSFGVKVRLVVALSFFCVHFWVSLDNPGTILGHFGPCWSYFVFILGHLGAILGPSWVNLGASWAILEPSWGHFGRILSVSSHLGAIMGHLGPEGCPGGFGSISV